MRPIIAAPAGPGATSPIASTSALRSSPSGPSWTCRSSILRAMGLSATSVRLIAPSSASISVSTPRLYAVLRSLRSCSLNSFSALVRAGSSFSRISEGSLVTASLTTPHACSISSPPCLR